MRLTKYAEFKQKLACVLYRNVHFSLRCWHISSISTVTFRDILSDALGVSVPSCLAASLYVNTSAARRYERVSDAFHRAVLYSGMRLCLILYNHNVKDEDKYKKWRFGGSYCMFYALGLLASIEARTRSRYYLFADLLSLPLLARASGFWHPSLVLPRVVQNLLFIIPPPVLLFSPS